VLVSALYPLIAVGIVGVAAEGKQLEVMRGWKRWNPNAIQVIDGRTVRIGCMPRC
jgi:hypothetical protein